MRKKTSKIIAVIKNDIQENTKSYLIVIIIFTIGVFFGVMFVNQMQDKSDIKEYINTYIDTTKSIENGNYLNELQKDVKNNIILTFLVWFSGTTIIGIPIVLGIILVRGFCLGFTISSCVYVLGKLKGIIFILITIFVQNIIFIPALIILGVNSIKLYQSIIRDRRRENIKLSILRHSIISVCIMLIMIASSVLKIEISYRLIVSLIKYF